MVLFKSSNILFSVALIYSMITAGAALRCFECNDIPHPALCDTVTECSTTSKCFIQKQYYAYGEFYLYSMGCMSDAKCTQTAYMHSNQSASDTLFFDDVDISLYPVTAAQVPHDVINKRSDGVTICNDCCENNNFCNLDGCGIQAADVTTRGPYCFECDVAGTAYGCRTVKQCDVGYACSVERSNFAGLYTVRCVPESDCIPHFPGAGVLIGRRAATRAQRVPFCCKTDYCNDIISPNKTVATVRSPWTTWSDWSACSLSCGPGGWHHRTRQCRTGQTCTGQELENGHCSNGHCKPVDVSGHWTHWSDWSRCSATCLTGRKHRSRQCVRGVHCPGTNTQYQWCHMGPCPNVSSRGIQCMECNDVPDPSKCVIVTQCAPGSTCFVKKYITSAGQLLYSSGCSSQTHCNELGSASGNDDPYDIITKRATGDVTLCDDCCDNQDFCNKEGCGVKVASYGERGPYCFTCSNQPHTEYNRCIFVRECQRGQMCGLKATAVIGTYTSGCFSQTTCSHAQENHIKCCKGDFCNDFVHHPPAHQTQGDSWFPWGDWTACSASCDAGYQERHRRCRPGANCTTGSGDQRSYCNKGPCPNSTALRCFECTDVPDPSVCPTVTECVAPATCFVRQYITSAGSRLYSSGCMSSAMCKELETRPTTHSQKRDTLQSDNDVMVCEECCRQGSFCNNEGCAGKAQNTTTMGPYCFSCLEESSAYGCRTVRRCAHGQVCSIRHSAYPDMFYTNCILEKSCKTVHTSKSVTVADFNHASAQGPYCCRGDFCNEFDHTPDVTSLVG